MTDKPLTGYPSIDKPWLKYYSEEAINAPLPECTIYEYLWENNKDHLDDVAIIYYNKEITYDQMFIEIDRVAKAFAAFGVKQDDVVTLLMLNQPETVYCLYALSKLGATANYINVLSSESEIERYMKECSSKFVVTLDMFTDKIPQKHTKEIVTVSLFQSLGILKRTLYKLKVKAKHIPSEVQWNSFLKCEQTYAVATYQKEHAAIIGHTGGTTGVPKSFSMNDSAINGVIQEYKYNIRYQRGDVFLDMIIPFVLYGLCINLHMPLSLGMKTVLVPKAQDTELPGLLLKFHPNHISNVPAFWLPVLTDPKLQNADLSNLQTVGAGGAGMTLALESQLNAFFEAHNSTARILNGYGMSEVCATACTCQYDHIKSGSVGIPLSHNIFAAFDVETQKELPYGKLGEICIATPYLMMEYLDNPSETKNLIRTHSDGHTWVHTGDIGYIDAEGFVFIKERMKRLFSVNTDGITVKVFPDRIEEIANSFEAISNSCAVPVFDKVSRNRVVLYVESEIDIQQRTSLVEQIMQKCRDTLPIQYIPLRIEFIHKIPLTAAGKVDYRTLEKQAEEIQND